MKFKGLIIAIVIAIAFTACSQTKVGNLKLETREDSVAYAIGVMNYIALTAQDMNLDPMKIAKGAVEAEEGTAIFDETTARGYYSMYMRDLQDEKIKEQYGDIIKESESFLEKNRLEDGVKVTESGLQYKVVTEGTGPKPTLEDKVRVHYSGTLVNGTKFDSSYDNGEPIEFNLNGVITGWKEGLQLMPVGSKYMLYIPYSLGYGSRGAGQDIPPFSTLIFEVELLDIVTQ